MTPLTIWEDRAAYHEREVQAIKRRLRRLHGGVFDVYAGIGARGANRLREELEKHRVARDAAASGRNPTREEIDDAIQSMRARGES